MKILPAAKGELMREFNVNNPRLITTQQVVQ
jgi:hypothetical protein